MRRRYALRQIAATPRFTNALLKRTGAGGPKFTTAMLVQRGDNMFAKISSRR